MKDKVDGVGVQAPALIEDVHPIAQGAVLPTTPAPAASTLNPAYTVDLSTWTMGDYMDFQDAVTEGIFRETTIFLVKIVKKWPHAGDPTKPESYRALKAVQWKETAEAAVSAMSAAFQNPA